MRSSFILALLEYGCADPNGCLLGVEVVPVEVQVQLSSGLPGFTIVGLPDKAVAESRERVRGSLIANGLALPAKKITVNLAPADVVKEGSHFDLPIALALLVVQGLLPEDAVAGKVVLGELGLDGSIASVSGVLPAALYAAQHEMGLICPEKQGGEAAWAGDIPICAAGSLLALMNHFKGTQLLKEPEPKIAETNIYHRDMSDIKGQETAKRALEICAAGGHNLLMIGPPGSGKSMLAARLPGILPDLEPSEALEVSMVHSLAGSLKEGQLLRERPFRDPHHSASLPSLVGGGLRAKPGEVSLAHLGVLFLDELPEFARGTLEALRQPLETGRVSIARANAHVTYPARVQLIAAMNPCRCGYLEDPGRACSKAPKCALDYQSKISGPLFDRIDLHVDVPAVSANDLALPKPGEGTKEVKERVFKARQRQIMRYKDSQIRTNAEIDGDLLEKSVALDQESKSLMIKAVDKFRLSARGYHRVMRVARTLADLEGTERVNKLHLSEALNYRRLSPGQVM